MKSSPKLRGSHDLLAPDELLELTQSELDTLRQGVDLVIHKTLEEGWTTRDNDPSRVTRLRISNLPFCDMRAFLELGGKTAKRSKMNFASSYFTSVGSIIHTVIQDALSNALENGLKSRSILSIEVVRDWKCLGCSVISTLQTRPMKCASCGDSNFRPMEATVEHGLVLGHVDEILQVGLMFKGKPRKIWVVLDYKTTSIFALPKKKLLQDMEYIHQISSYTAILRSQGYPAAFAALVYVPRDNPFKTVVHFIKVSSKRTLDNLRLFRERFLRMGTVKSDAGIWEMVKQRPCRNGPTEEFPKCRFAAVCAGKGNKEAVYFRATELRATLGTKLPILSKEHLKMFDKEI